MKKIIIGAFILSSMLLVGCSSTQKISTLENKHLLWSYAGSLPAQRGFEKNVGVAGLLEGTIGEYIIVGGGANFPDVLEKGGKKITHKDLYLLKEKDGILETLDQVQLDYPIGYGASVNIDNENAIYYLGGSPDKNHDKDILKVTLNNNKIKAEVVGHLPLAFANGVIAHKNGQIYFGVGKLENPEGALKNSNRFFVYDIKNNITKELEKFPGDPRQQTIGEILNDKFYVFSGGSNISYTDGYAYDFSKNSWNKVSDVIVNNQKILLLGANSLKISNDSMLVIGGFNYQLWNDANYYLSNLKDEELKNYKAEYFGAEPNWYNWNRKILIYNATNDSWKSIGEVPFDAPCGAALQNIKNSIYSINGEIKPGVRTDRIYKGIISY